MIDAEWLRTAFAEVERLLEGDAQAAQVQAAVRLWVDATLHVDDAGYHERFERRLAEAIGETGLGAWCEGEVTALDVARTLHTCARAARLYSTRFAALTSAAAPVKHVS